MGGFSKGGKKAGSERRGAVIPLIHVWFHKKQAVNKRNKVILTKCVMCFSPEAGPICSAT